MLKKFLLILTLSSFALLTVQAITIVPKADVSLSNSSPKFTAAFNLSSLLNETNKAASVKIKIANKSLVKSQPAAIKLQPDSETGEITATNISFFSSKATLKKLTQSQSVAVQLIPNAAAKKLGIENSTFNITLVPNATSNLTADISFGGEPLLPSHSGLSRVIGRNPDSKFLDLGSNALLSIPSNTGSCAIGFGNSTPLATDFGPGGEDTSASGGSRFGSGTETDPLYIVLNNPNNGGSNETLSISAVPLDLLSSDGVPGFVQLYEGLNGTGKVLATLSGTIKTDIENKAISLTLPDGFILSLSESSGFDPTDLATLTGRDGLNLNQALDFLEGGEISISVPTTEISDSIESQIAENVGADANVLVDLNSDLTGSLTLTGNRMDGSFSTGATISFDVPMAGTQTLTGVDNIQMTISSDNPALMTGFALQNASGSLTISGGTGVVKSITADFVINHADISIENGINSSDVTITNVTIEQDDSGDGDGGDDAHEQCIQQCTEQGGNAETCAAACASI